jgi:DNA-binding PadR family transcriptional regulator
MTRENIGKSTAYELAPLAANVHAHYAVTRYSLTDDDTELGRRLEGKMGPKKKLALSFLPLTPAMFHILLALADGEKHGYAILKEVLRRTDDKVRLSAGTLYGNLARLENSGWIVESNKRPEVGLDDERRRYYRLTELGRAVALAEAERMQQALEQAYAMKLFHKPKLV